MEKRTLKELFRIEQEEDVAGSRHLLLALGDKHCCLAVSDPNNQLLSRLVYLQREEEPGWGWDETELEELLHTYPFLRKKYDRVKVCYQFADALLATAGSVTPGQADLLTGSLSAHHGKTITETVPGWQLETLYKIPVHVADWVGSHFQQASCFHQYTIAITQCGTVSEAGSIQVDVRRDELLVTLAQNNRVLLSQTFAYSTPEDVLYHLLNACHQFSLSADRVQLQVSGLVEARSALYRELVQYFRNLSFREAGWNGGPEYPAHFFTTLNDLARCAS